MVNYYIRHGSDPEGSNCMDYYRVKHMLHHLFVNQEHLLLVNGQIYESYIGSHTHPEAEARIRVTPSLTMSTPLLFDVDGVLDLVAPEKCRHVSKSLLSRLESKFPLPGRSCRYCWIQYRWEDPA